MEIETAVKFIPIGKAILFLGAGFSSELMAVDREAVPSVRKLSEIFASKVGVPSSLPLDITAREYLRNASPGRINEYVNLMRSSVKVSEYKEWHKKTVFANWRSIYTTNYDDCVELIERDINIGIRPISPYSPLSFYDVKVPIVHLHGFVDDLNESSYKDALLLTRDQYASYETNHKYWDFLQRDIESSSAIFFCGFSLSDWHIEKILSKSPYNKEKTFFILRKDSEDNEELKYRLNEYGNIYFGGIEEFSRLIPPYTERSAEVAAPQFLRKISEIQALDITSSKAAEDVHFFGHHSLELAEFDRTSSSPVLLKREVQDSIVASLEEGKRFHLVHAEMGDGKTLIGEMILAKLISGGKSVVFLNERRPDKAALLRFCRSAGSDTVIAMLETEIQLHELIELTDACADREIQIIYCCRSAYFDLAHDERKVIKKTFQVWRIPTLSVPEFNDLNRIYERYGLWGDLQGKGLKIKQQYVLKDCKGEFRTLSIGHLHQKRLLDVLHNEIARISWISESLTDLVILAMIYSYLGRSAKIHVLNKLISKRAYDLASLNFLYGNFNIIYIKNGEYAVPSSIFSREMLKSLFHADRIKAVIENSFIKSSEFGNHEFSDFRRDVMQYGSLQRILVRPGGSPDLDNIISLFRSFADTGIEKGNIHFWQQYSIALYINEEFELSQKRLDTAKSLAREMSYYDTFMLDHHQARLLLVSRARRVNEYKDHEEAYVEALQTAVRLISDPNRPTERDTLYLSEHLGEAFAGEALSIVKNSTRVKLALQAMLEAVSNRKPNASVGLSLLRRTVRDIRLALDALTQPE